MVQQDLRLQVSSAEAQEAVCVLSGESAALHRVLRRVPVSHGPAAAPSRDSQRPSGEEEESGAGVVRALRKDLQTPFW